LENLTAKMASQLFAFRPEKSLQPDCDRLYYLGNASLAGCRISISDNSVSGSARRLCCLLAPACWDCSSTKNPGGVITATHFKITLHQVEEMGVVSRLPERYRPLRISRPLGFFLRL